ncbi:MAG TPA: hypothetical protein GX742_04340, partial [Acholeplasmataceae bacterium]|nr:hypothetical protein [Acholeplasmataceae bacterium]
MKINLRSFLTIVITILVVFGLLIVTDIITKPIIENNEMKLKIEEYSEILDDIDTIETLTISEEFVSDAQKAVNDKGEIIGYLFTASKDNQWGSILIRMAVSANGEIIGVTSVVDQSLSADETKAYITKFIGSKIESPEALDGSTGPTTRDSVLTAEELIGSISKAFISLEIEPDLTEIELIYGKGAVATLDDSFTGNELVLMKEDIYLEDTYLGSLYLLKGTGIYHQTNEGSLEYKVALDEDLNILGFIEIEY